ncbi:hypothetical protein ARAF_1593 [Arsenophonus endosymbiont of Aleurodicus floccissimus]|uniref:hypothetical protein n=1 Tax=Arsenophonus endosymbiont of Aleurodicus floccissimus TaxID=2152761 RepID=UPI000EC38AF3|nr:hypothetical protein [Arsenophonus endosymbiont of Aleurodicus floccissimus]SPP31925.1 hypothetical protein ARAF_1593 [Arsenophonus endosymbiont of Aleurodicus floccissimus]
MESQRYKTWLSSQKFADYRTGKVPACFYPYDGELNAEQWLTVFLESQDSVGERISDILCKEGLTLCIEPGRKPGKSERHKRILSISSPPSHR